MALTLTRKNGEKIMIVDTNGELIEIQVVEIEGLMKLRVDAPKSVQIYREEVFEQYRDRRS